MSTSNHAPVSVVIPAHNESRYIRQALESVNLQTLPVAETIVVADSCRDDTASKAVKVGARVIEISSRNISAARNAGIRAATQKWIAFLDADDYWHKNKIRRQWRALESLPAAALVTSDFFTVFNGRISFRPKKELEQRRRELQCPVSVIKGAALYPKVDGTVLRQFEVSPQATLVRKDVFETSGFFDESLEYLQDVEFFARALKDHSLLVIEEPLVYRRIRPDSHSANSQGKWQAYLSIVDRMLRHPDSYAPGAGEEYREHIKIIFAANERSLETARQREK